MTQEQRGAVSRVTGSLGVAANTVALASKALRGALAGAERDEQYLIGYQAQILHDEAQRLQQMAEDVKAGRLLAECCPCDTE